MNDFYLYPKVYLSGKTQNINIKLSNKKIKSVKIRIQPMESYTIKHTSKYRIDENNRYPLNEMHYSNGIFSIKYKFIGEQRYSINIFADDKVLPQQYVYSINEDIKELKPFKGDTHLHSTCSDGECDPFTVAINYREKGFDFIALTDHHKYLPTVDLEKNVSKLTNMFHIFRGEEVHNCQMGYFHIINFGGNSSVNSIIESSPDYLNEEVNKILKTKKLPNNVDKYAVSYRIAISKEIRKTGGLAIMAHPFWDVYGEYNMQEADIRYLLSNNYYDALEILADTDPYFNGDNLQIALWSDLRLKGKKLNVVGASDTHKFETIYTRFNKCFSLCFAKDYDDILNAIKKGQCVAIHNISDNNFYAFGEYRFVKYARFIYKEYYPTYTQLTKEHSIAMKNKNKKELRVIETKIKAYQKDFFAF